MFCNTYSKEKNYQAYKETKKLCTVVGYYCLSPVTEAGGVVEEGEVHSSSCQQRSYCVLDKEVNVACTGKCSSTVL